MRRKINTYVECTCVYFLVFWSWCLIRMSGIQFRKRNCQELRMCVTFKDLVLVKDGWILHVILFRLILETTHAVRLFFSV